ncbi:ankyrin repeat domain-containing protein [Aggregatibacter kilianii]|uniref:ankyrin repeat domain-containing protein n=1 Tax=Aggregatibacter kilianii TaxID=2025884 RepID=UPI0013A60E20|nr:hypothetical protein [Aggregatibacter kilianii]
MTYSVNDFYGKNQKELAEAIWQKDVKKVEELAPHTDLHTLSKKNMSLLMLPIVRISEDLNGNNEDYYKIITILTKNGADPDQEQGENTNDSPLMTAVLYYGAPPQILEALLKGGLDPNYKQKRFMNIPIIFTVTNDVDHEKFKLLIDYGAEINSYKEGSPLVIETAYVGAKNTLYILERGADINVTGRNGLTVPYLIYTNIEDSIQSKKLIEEGKTIWGDKFRDTSLIEETLRNEEKVRDFLIKKGVKWPPETPPQVQKNLENQKNYQPKKRYNINY